MKKVFLASSILILAGCGGGSDENLGIAAPEACDVASQNQFVYDVMRDSYLWADQVPDLDPLSFDSPEALLEYIVDAVELDRWSNITNEAAFSQFYEEGIYEGFGISYRYLDNNELALLLVFDDSPFGKEGFKRSDTIVAMNGLRLSSLSRVEIIDIFNSEEPIDFVVRSSDGNEREAKLGRDLVTMNTVLENRTIDVTGVKYGYIALSSFLETSVPELTEVFSNFSRDGVDEIILDLRYNSGGRIDTAVHLGTLMGGQNVDGKVFGKREHNENYASRNSDRTFNSTSAQGYETVTIITTARTCSASELIINSLDPHINVQLVGAKTCGKPVGTYGTSFCEKRIQPIEFITANADGFNDYFDGFTPTCSVEDNDVSRDFGDPAEGMLKAALSFANAGQCTTDSVSGFIYKDIPISAESINQ